MSALGSIKEKLGSAEFAEYISRTYGCSLPDAGRYIDRIGQAVRGFEDTFGTGGSGAFVCTAAGRTEICGNHTDHQRGHVLAASVSLDAIAVVSPNHKSVTRVYSLGYGMTEVGLGSLGIHIDEKNTTAALVRGILAKTAEYGYNPSGFDAYVISDVPAGSGLSSSACYEVLIGVAVNHLYCADELGLPAIAVMGQYAENAYFGKPSGLMDQMACAVGGLISIDFSESTHPKVERIDFDFAGAGHALCIIDTGASHADLTSDYATIPAEMCAAAGVFGRKVLGEVDEETFYEGLPQVRSAAGDRAMLRAAHFFEEERRVREQVSALKSGDFDAFLHLASEAGRSSFMYLQNVSTYRDPSCQPVAAALCAAEHFLHGRGCVRIQGGGFAGTIQAFVPFDILDDFRKHMDALLGDGACRTLSVRPVGGAVLIS